MNPVFILSKKKLYSVEKLNIKYRNDHYFLYSNQELKAYGCKSRQIHILIDGYVIPRLKTKSEYSNISQFELIYQLYMEFGLKYVDHIKGVFTVLTIDKEEIHVLNDHHSLKKFFYTQNDDFLLSNRLKLITNNLSSTINETSIKLHSLYQHFMDGQTFIKNVYYSEAATKLTISYTGHNISRYWSWQNLSDLSRNPIAFKDFSDLFSQIIDQYITFLKPSKISLTLTGGRDTRTILSSLLSSGHKPNVFTFGNSASADAVSAHAQAKNCSLDLMLYHQKQANPKWYSELTDEIVETGNSMTHIHRAHRLDAIKKEVKRTGKDSILFLGMMGGDYIKGAHLDDYILTSFVREYWFEHKNNPNLIKKHLEKHFINDSFSDFHSIDSTKHFSSLQPKNLELAIVENIIANLHDSQDISVFSEYIDYVVAPFMDIDFLELLFSSNYSLFDNFEISKNPFKKMKGGDLQCSIIKNLYPPLADVPFANQYTPNDLLGNKYLYYGKRIYLKAFGSSSPPSFPYGNWFGKFMATELNQLHPILKEFLDTDNTLHSFNNSTHKNFEGYWHRYSNIIMYSKFAKFYKL